jgi:hypothetical protein
MGQKELLMSIANALIEKYCEKYPDEYCFDDQGLGMTKTGRILDADGGDPKDTLLWVLEEGNDIPVG